MSNEFDKRNPATWLDLLWITLMFLVLATIPFWKSCVFYDPREGCVHKCEETMRKFAGYELRYNGTVCICGDKIKPKLMQRP